MNKVKLKDCDINTIKEILKDIPEVEQAIIFGSRAKGNARNGSDVDLALKGNNIRFETISHVSYLLNEETMMPYRFDVVNYHTITSRELIEHIDRVGVTIYHKQKDVE